MAPTQTLSSPPPQSQSQSTFPQDPAEFDADPRISFDKLNQKFILETEDDKGQPLEFEYDDGLKRWVSVVRFYPLPLVGGPLPSYAKDDHRRGLFLIAV